MREGWICPRCQKVWSPDVTSCTCQSVKTNSPTTTDKWWEQPNITGTGTVTYPVIIENLTNNYTIPTEES